MKTSLLTLLFYCLNSHAGYPVDFPKRCAQVGGTFEHGVCICPNGKSIDPTRAECSQVRHRSYYDKRPERTEKRRPADPFKLTEGLANYAAAAGCLPAHKQDRSPVEMKRAENYIHSFDWTGFDFLGIVRIYLLDRHTMPAACIPPLLDFIPVEEALTYFKKQVGANGNPSPANTFMLDNIVFSLVHEGLYSYEQREEFRKFLRPLYIDFGLVQESQGIGTLLKLGAWLGDAQVVATAKQAIERFEKRGEKGPKLATIHAIAEALVEFRDPDRIAGVAEAETQVLLSRIVADPHTSDATKKYIQEHRKHSGEPGT